MKRNKLFVEIFSALLIILWVYAAMSKLLAYQNFKIQLGKSPLLTDFAPLVAWLIPALELGIAILLVIPKTRLYGLNLSLSLLVAFTTYLFVILNYSETIPCSCGGLLSSMDWTEHIIFNLAFAVMAVVAIIIELKLNPQSKQRKSYRLN